MLTPDRLLDKMHAGRAAWGALAWTTPLPDDARGLLPPARVAEVFPATWARLSPDGRLALARLLTAADHEAFILFEEALVASLRVHLAATGPAPQTTRRALLEQFVAEELDHIDAFRHYLAVRFPDRYTRHGPMRYHFKPALGRRLLLTTMTQVARARPQAVFVFAEFFELLTIRLARIFAEAHAHGEAIDPLLVAIHTLHADEEGRHVAVDKIVVGDEALSPSTSLAALAVFAAIGLVEQASYRRVAATLVETIPEARDLGPSLAADVRLTERTRVVDETVRRFMPTFVRLRTGPLAPIFRAVMLRMPLRG